MEFSRTIRALVALAAALFIVAITLFWTDANAQVHVNIGSTAAPRMPSFTEPAMEADNARSAQRRHPIMTISIRNRWRFDCYSPATAEECARAAMIVQKAYADVGGRPLLSGTYPTSGFGTPKWQTTCYLKPSQCEVAIGRLQTVDTNKE